MQIFSINRKFNIFFAILLLAAATMILAGCSDNTAAVNNATTPPPATTATSVQLLVSSQQMLSYANATTDMTAVVLDTSGQAVSGQPVTFGKGNDASAFFTNLTGITDANGIATAKLNIGTDMSNRVISVSATSGTAAGANTVTVAGTKISISGNTSLALNASTVLTIIVKDSVGVAVPGVALTVASQIGNQIVLSPSTGITDATGQITATYTANNANGGTDVLTVSGAGATQTQTLTINSASFAFTAPLVVPPATTPEIVVNTATPVSILWTSAGIPVADGTTVYFSTSRGTITASATTTAGVATASITAGSTGATILTASGPGGTPAATLNVVFITTSASSVTAQAFPGTVAINTGGNSSNQSVISVVVRDANNNLVKNAHINFTQVADVSGGSLAASSATTDITGSASVNYIAGSTSSGPGGVRIDATVDMVNGVAITPQITSSVFLTVASQALFVRLGTDNKVYPDTPIAGVHTKEYTALVTDSAGNPAPDGTEVRFVLRPATPPVPAFFKGHWWYNGNSTKWYQHVTASCVTEDANFDGLMQPGEDINGNTRLDPNGTAAVNTSATTVSGFAIAKITYAKDHAFWIQMELEARAGTIGNDPPTVATVVPVGLAADYTGTPVDPPGVISPFGYGDDSINPATGLLLIDPATGLPFPLHNFCTDAY